MKISISRKLSSRFFFKTLRKFGVDYSETELPIDFNGKPVIKIPYQSNKYIGILGFHNKIENDDIVGCLKSSF